MALSARWDLAPLNVYFVSLVVRHAFIAPCSAASVWSPAPSRRGPSRGESHIAQPPSPPADYGLWQHRSPPARHTPS
eukprot:7530031-Alexandrium_andersonii.AAC.1